MTTEQISHSLSLLHTHNALSLKSIMLELGITRSEARQIMEGVATQMDECYTAVRIAADGKCVKLGNAGSIFSIIKSPKESSSISNEGCGDALQATVAANEKSLADQRDLSSTSDGWAELIRIFSDAEIRPAAEYLEGGVIRTVARDRVGGVIVSGVASSTSSGNNKSTGKQPTKRGKETTAATFFGSKTTTKKETKKTTAKDITNEVKGKENNKSTDESREKAEARKEGNAAIPQKNSANVDDFVGDEDEDEEFIQDETERKARVAREARKQVRASATNENAKRRNTSSLSERRKSNPDKMQKKNNDDAMDIEEKKESDEEEIEYDDCVKKPMDAFAKRTTPNGLSGGGGAKKRRKKLVEKTIMENGYLKTVTEEIWEEYTEEEKALPSATAKKSAKPSVSKKMGQSKGKKQGNLMGFFGKK